MNWLKCNTDGEHGTNRGITVESAGFRETRRVRCCGLVQKNETRLSSSIEAEAIAIRQAVETLVLHLDMQTSFSK